MSDQVYVKPRPGPVRRFVRSLISHLIFALIMVAAAFGLVYHKQIFNRLGDELCTDDRLGGYMTKARAPQPAPPVTLERTTSAPQPSVTPQPQAASPAPAAPPPAAAQTPPQAVPQVAAVPAASPPSDVAPAAAPPAASLEVKSPDVKPTEAKAPEAKAPEASASAGEPVAAKPAEPVQPAPAAETAPATAVAARREAPTEAAAPAPAPKPAAEPGTQAQEKTAAAPATGAEAPPLAALMSEWQAARQAYAGNKAEAVEAYRKLIAKHPQVVELRGELGNVYYALGQKKEAADQYYEAALQHLKGPQPGLAACLAEVIKPIDADRAKVLEEKTAGHPCPYRRSK